MCWQRILKLFKIFDRLAEDARFNPASFRLLTLAVSLFFMSHLFGCLWYMASFLTSLGHAPPTRRRRPTLSYFPWSALLTLLPMSSRGRYMVVSWADGTLDDYHQYYHNATAQELSDAAGTYIPRDRYPLDELLDASRMGPEGVGRKWLLCFTWAMGLFTGLMPIDLHPWRSEEMAFTCVALVFAMIFNALIISASSSAMAAMDFIARHHKAKLDRVRDYMRFNSVPSELSHTILEFYKYICLNSQTQDDLKDFVDLPQQLHFKLAIALHRELITKCPLFVEFDNYSILRILSFLRPITLPPETVVLRQGQEHSAMYFVSRGMLWAVEFFASTDTARPERLVSAVGNHEFFGDEGVMGGALPAYTIVTKTYCVLMALTSKDFDTACPRLKGGKKLREGVGEERSLAKILDLLRRKGAAEAPSDSENSSFTKTRKAAAAFKGRPSISKVVAALRTSAAEGNAPSSSAGEEGVPKPDAAAAAVLSSAVDEISTAAVEPEVATAPASAEQEADRKAKVQPACA